MVFFLLFAIPATALCLFGMWLRDWQDKRIGYAILGVMWFLPAIFLLFMIIAFLFVNLFKA